MPKSAFPHWIYDGSAIADPFGYGQEAVDFIRALKHPASAVAKGRFADAIKADPALQAFKDKHLACTDYDDTLMDEPT